MHISPLQLEQTDRQIKRLIKADNFYGRKMKEAGIEGIKTEEDFLKLPFSHKEDLRDAYPLGLMAVPEEEIVRIHSSSGTTGGICFKSPIITTCTPPKGLSILRMVRRRESI